MKPLMIITVLGVALATAAIAQQSTNQPAQAPKEPPVSTQKPADSPAPPAEPAQPNQQQSAEQVLNELLKRRAENPLIEPARADAPSGTPRGADSSATPGGRPMGTAPKIASGASLRREGQFVINRRARLVRAPASVGSPDAPSQGLPWMVVFDADADGLQDPPMYVMPCQLLERIETMARQYGDTAVFLTSGQVYVYRGANYLLPTIMQLAHDRGNLQP